MFCHQVDESTAGVYSCMPDNISPAIININIIGDKEEQLAVTNTGNMVSVTSVTSGVIICLMTFFRVIWTCELQIL